MTSHVSQRLLPTAGAASLAFALLLTACRTVPLPEAVPSVAPVPVVPAAAAPTVAAVPRPSLAEEQRRLAALFRGTPVGFTMQRDGSLRINVPLRYCFDAGQFTVKAPLAAVLEHLALSQEDGNSHIAISVPADATPRRGKTRVSDQRAIRLREYLSYKGIADSRVTISIAASGTAARSSVGVVVTEAPEP